MGVYPMPPFFITTQELSDRLGRDVTSDPAATLAVESACDICRDIAEQQFTPGTATVKLDGTGSDCLILPFRPVSNVTAVSIAGAAVTDFVFNEAGFLFRGSAGIFPGPAWPSGRQNIAVTYVFGTTPAPASVREVALQIAMRLVVQGVAKTEQIGDVRIDYGMQASDLTVNELRILRRHRRTRSF